MGVKQMVWFAVVVALLLIPVRPGTAQDQVTVTLDTITLAPGESGSINAMIDCPLEGGCSAFAIEIRFDPAVVGVDDALVGPYLGDESLRAEKLIDNETGMVRLAAVALGAQPEYGEPVLLTLDLTARAAGVALLTFFELQIADVAGNPADARGIAGSVVVMDTSSAVRPVAVIGSQRAYLRAAPNARSTVIDQVSDVQLPVVGRTADGVWYQVEWEGQTVWVSRTYVVAVEGDLSGVPVAQP